ncbi:UDP-GlcNAc:undecaprenyl-phosphate GlcNAc-1-phosphate transferase [Ferrimonas sediminum]|uniref:Undecaprenyl-phosphate alpha-N-acetylglucosaminyl 1-phosphate transferase n=1 Tax=Ferrimonas sediminum TaxID=718193 RepID=A0A1G8YZM7_9GAMM|nr:UDP-N-acetylglucosamine--undecaprenyl-phosphate N-acetylglucosaminephosphotransferase [Ferrimonas sediminum]SDK08187.1 UDP-GlcNAc:undecaprenyl-phosphate GlcNAc-1-phosphate transferase [Ferrimonas sediminum]
MELFAILFWTFIVSYSSVRLAKPLAYRVGLVDKPNERKHHDGAIPLIGGIAIFIGVMSAIMIFLPHNQILNLYLLSAAIILLLGVLDDRHDLKVSYRMAVQALSACIMIFGAGLYLESLGNIFGLFELHLSHIGILITIVAVIGAINAFNMVDGIDGLAGMLSIVTFSGLAILFAQAGNVAWILPVLFIAAICAYLTFNLGWPNRRAKKIFMGDAGSMLIGLTVVWLLVYGSQGDSVAFRPVTALWVIALPLMDMAAIMFRRVRKGQSPFKPDRNHLHHICMRAGLTQRQSLVLITIFASVIVCAGIVAESMAIPEWVMFISFILLYLVYSYSIQNIWKIVKRIRMLADRDIG